MKHRVFAPTFGVVAAALIAAGVPSQASAADPSGIWAKDDGSAKMEITKCGRGICSKIVWLSQPNDSRGRPLHDARNENASMRDRPILGLPLFSDMKPVAPNTWVGSVYNPEEGRIYTDIKVTLVSRQQIVLKGCKAWLLCGEKVWLKSKLPAAPAATEEPIEVKAPGEPSAPDETAPKPGTPVLEASTREPVAKPAFQPATVGLGIVMVTATSEPLPLSGENVSSMMVMTKPAPAPTPAGPAATEPVVEAALGEEDPAPVTPRKPTAPETQAKAVTKAKPKAQVSVEASVSAAPPARAVKPRTKPQPTPVTQEPEERLPWLRQ